MSDDVLGDIADITTKERHQPANPVTAVRSFGGEGTGWDTALGSSGSLAWTHDAKDMPTRPAGAHGGAWRRLVGAAFRLSCDWRDCGLRVTAKQFDRHCRCRYRRDNRRVVARTPMCRSRMAVMRADFVGRLARPTHARRMGIRLSCPKLGPSRSGRWSIQRRAASASDCGSRQTRSLQMVSNT